MSELLMQEKSRFNKKDAPSCCIFTEHEKSSYSTMTNQILLIQKWIRRYLVKKRVLIPSSFYQTKIWRKNQKWYKNGKHTECEKYQLNLIEKIIKLKLVKTEDRINTETYKIVSTKFPMKKDNGYEYTENFDYTISTKKSTVYFNLKFVCERGGSQTRSLREVYHFIRYQLEYLITFNSQNVFFVNILDGDEVYRNIDKFTFLYNKERYRDVVKYVFIGDLNTFQTKWYRLVECKL